MSTLAPFIRFGECKSHDKDNPNVMELQIVDPETFETAYSVNIRVRQKESGGEWIEKILPLKNHESKNPSLLKEWEKNARKDLTKKNKIFKLQTWLDVSKLGNPIRRYRLDF